MPKECKYCGDKLEEYEYAEHEEECKEEYNEEVRGIEYGL